MAVPPSAAFASQATFRALMGAFARPGDIAAVDNIEAPAPLMPASAAVIKSLADFETPIWLDSEFSARPETGAWIRFHTGARLTNEKKNAAFALIADASQLPDFSDFALGSEEYPDRSTTLVVHVADFSGTPFVLTGPGLKGPKEVAIAGLPSDFVARFSESRELFPRGVDLVLTAGARLMALPRSILIAESA